MRFFRWHLSVVLLFASSAAAAVNIEVNAAQEIGPWDPVWTYFGYDEPNYTYAANGSKLIRELAELSATPVYIRTHNLLTSGNGEAGLKVGSTNVYTEDAQGRPHYDWTILDRIFDTYVKSGAKPLVEIGFMPKALSTRPEPYTPIWQPGENFDRYFVGWTFPPKSFEKWGELVSHFVRHLAERYGKNEVQRWPFEVWNEPDIAYWHGTAEEYDRLYDFTAAAVKREIPIARVGGPGSTGPGNAKAAAFLRQFLQHCSTGENAASGGTGAPLDFISYHAKGRPAVNDGKLRMGLGQHLEDVASGFEIVKEFPAFRQLPIILTESDPEGCAACPARIYPQNAYRNGTLYAAYEAAALKSMLELATEAQVNLKGVLTWAFEFEGQPYFSGFRSLATNGIDKPVLDAFRMLGLLDSRRVMAKSQGAIGAQAIIRSGVRGRADVDALAARSGQTLGVLVWNYRDSESEATPEDIELQLRGLPPEAKRVLVEHFRIDGEHSNSYAMWRKLGSPQEPSAEQWNEMRAASELGLLESPKWTESDSGSVTLALRLPGEALSLVRLSW